MKYESVWSCPRSNSTRRCRWFRYSLKKGFQPAVVACYKRCSVRSVAARTCVGSHITCQKPHIFRKCTLNVPGLESRSITSPKISPSSVALNNGEDESWRRLLICELEVDIRRGVAVNRSGSFMDHIYMHESHLA